MLFILMESICVTKCGEGVLKCVTVRIALFQSVSADVTFNAVVFASIT